MRSHIAMNWLPKSSVFKVNALPSSRKSFTGIKSCVNHWAGRDLGLRCLFTFQGDANVLWVGLDDGHLGSPSKMFKEVKQQKEKPMIKRYIPLTILFGACLLTDNASAHNGQGALFTAEISGIESLITGGYMRLGLLVVSGAAAIMGILKQNGWMFVSGIGGCAFIYFMKNWITTTFTMIA